MSRARFERLTAPIQAGGDWGGLVRALGLAVPLLAGCGLSLPDPTIDSITPDRGWTGEDTPIAIAGQNFLPQITFDAGSSDADVDRDFTAWLVELGGAQHPLEGVVADDYGAISAVVPGGLDPGTYGVRLAGPTGRIGFLPDAFTVSATRADRLALDADQVSWTVNTAANFEVLLLDPNNERVLEDLAVALDVVGEDGPVTPIFAANSLVGQTLVDADTLEGRLGDDGYALVGLTVAEPQVVTITARTLDPASPVRGGELKLQFNPGEDLVAEVVLPTSPFVAVAGTAFGATVVLYDQFGNRATDRTVDLALSDLCGTWAEVATITGSGTVPITLRTATDEACPQDAILAGELGQSPPFVVQPGDTSRFRVAVAPLEVTAGAQLTAVVTSEDGYGNHTPWSGTLTLADTLGGLTDVSCNAAGAGQYLCNAVPIVAGENVVLTAFGDDGTVGSSPPYRVVADPNPVEAAVFAPSVVTAGTAFTVAATAFDVYGNAIDAGVLGLEAFTLTDTLGEIACTATVVSGDGEALFSCTLTTGGADDLTVTLPAFGVASPSRSLVVVNGALAVVLATAPADAVAGVPFDVALAGFDLWGNPYVVQTTNSVDLADDSGTVSPATATLGAGGAAVVPVTVTHAGTTVVHASLAGANLGDTAPISVAAGPAVSLAVTSVEPWAFVGVPFTVDVTARDAWDNVAERDGTVLLSTVSGLASGTGPMTAGVAAIPLTWSDDVLDDVVNASSSTLFATSAPIDVARDCVVGAPTADLLFGGFPEAIACYDDAAETAEIVASFSGSVAGSGSLVGYALAAVGGPRLNATTSSVTLDLGAVGSWVVRGLVVQSDGCGAEVASTAWVGPDDGSVVGPVVLVPSTSAVDAGIGTALVDVVGATDCSRDPASFADLNVRTDRGELALSGSGAGLVVPLDVNGDATFTYDATSVDSGGDTRLLAWAGDTNQAFGEADLLVIGDSRRPEVWFQDPTGGVSGPVDAVTLRFSEPLLVTTAVPASFAIAGPSLASVSSVDLVADDEVVLGFSGLVDGSAGAWTITAKADLRDAAGNRLNGQYTGAAANYLGTFGAVGAPVATATCGTDVALFRPDGDDGAGVEADAAVLTVSATPAPAGWVFSVAPVGAPDASVRVDHVPASGTSYDWSWDGRAGDARIVDNGSWELTATPFDAAGNAGGACSVTLDVDNRGNAP